MPADSGSKYERPVLDLKGGLWVFRKSLKILTAGDQYFIFIQKTPPPTGIGLNIVIALFSP